MPDGADIVANEPTLDVTAEQIARTYAQALLAAAGDSAAEAVGDLEAVRAEVLSKHPGFAEALRSAFLDHEARVAMIDRVFGVRVVPSVVNFLKVLSAHGRMEIVGEVARQARLLHDEANNRVPVLVKLAHAVDDAVVAQIEKTIRDKTGVDPVTTVEVDPSLLGGLEVRVRDTVFDGSLRTAFAKAHKSIVNQTISAIENSPERFTLAE